jgi:hypothetical protein
MPEHMHVPDPPPPKHFPEFDSDQPAPMKQLEENFAASLRDAYEKALRAMVRKANLDRVSRTEEWVLTRVREMEPNPVATSFLTSMESSENAKEHQQTDVQEQGRTERDEPDEHSSMLSEARQLVEQDEKEALEVLLDDYSSGNSGSVSSAFSIENQALDLEAVLRTFDESRLAELVKQFGESEWHEALDAAIDILVTDKKTFEPGDELPF